MRVNACSLVLSQLLHQNAGKCASICAAILHRRSFSRPGCFVCREMNAGKVKDWRCDIMSVGPCE